MSVAIIKVVPIDTIILNPDNPRVIKDESFEKLVKSIQTFPKMLFLRPIIVDINNVVLGGNMRLEACRHLGKKEIPIMIADDLTDEQKKEFIIKDNISNGNWDYEKLIDGWDVDLLKSWDLDVPDLNFENNTEDKSNELSNDIFKIEVDCDNEDKQEKLYNELIERNFKCRLLTL